MISVHRALIEAACAPVGWDPRLLEAQVFVESSDDPWAFRYEPAYYTSYIQGHPTARAYVYGPLAACSYGLLQLVFETAVERGATRPDGQPLQPHDLFDPATNLRIALRHLQYLRARIGGPIDATLAAYNGGLVQNLHPPYRNAAYAQKVLLMKERLDA